MAKKAKAKKGNDDELEDFDLSADDAEAGTKDAEPELETPASRARKAAAKAAKEAKKQPEVKSESYEWKREKTYNDKKGLKLVRIRVTKNGGQSEFVGYEKRIPKSFLKDIRAKGLLKE